MTAEEAIETVRRAFDAWESEYDVGDDWSKKHEARDMAIKALEQEPVLDKIRAEIENHCGLAMENHCKYCSYCNCLMGVREILELIDKYKTENGQAESEE